jgi:hypothetical protein
MDYLPASLRSMSRESSAAVQALTVMPSRLAMRWRRSGPRAACGRYGQMAALSFARRVR